MTDQSDDRPKCEWPVKDGGTKERERVRSCGSEDRLFVVKAQSIGRIVPKDFICQEHLSEAWGKGTIDSAEPLRPEHHFNTAANFGMIVDGATINLNSDGTLTIDGIDVNLVASLTPGQRQTVNELKTWVATRFS